ncbi:MAG: cholesterol transport system auxiliary component [Bacteroidota bacterium]|nr:cholesterol transport system auxiliary component [Bacteroidota bacterium]
MNLKLLLMKLHGKKVILSLILTIVFSSCISLTVEYPEITLYQLTQDSYPTIIDKPLNGSLLIRDFTIASQFDTDHLFADQGVNQIKRYYYHRWSTDFSDLATDFFVDRYSEKGIFRGGVVKSSTMLVPDYILEGHITDLMAYNYDEDSEIKNYVYLSINFQFIRKEVEKTGLVTIFNKSYYSIIERPDNSVATIVPAYSKAILQISDSLITDIIKAVQ